MLKKPNSTIIIALCTSAALIAFAFDQRVTLSATAFYIAAAVICLLPVLYAVLRCKTYRNKTSNVA